MDQEHSIAFGPFRLETTQGRLWQGDRRIPLRPRSMAMLGYLVAHPGRLVTKAEVQQHVGGDACHRQLGETPQRFRVLQGLCRFHVTQAELPAAGELAQQFTHLVHRQSEADLVLAGQAGQPEAGLTAFDTVDLQEAKACLDAL